MKIVDAKVIVCRPGRNFVTLKLVTEDGIYGLGDATLNGRELAVASYLTDHVVPLLIGRDARRIEDIWQYLYKGAYWRRGPVTMSAIAAVDVALWDIKAKSLNTPLYELLGGASREAVLVYGHASGADLEKTPGLVRALCEPGIQSHSRAVGHSGIKQHLRHRTRRSGVRTCREGCASGEPMVHGTLHALRAATVRSAAERVWA